MKWLSTGDWQLEEKPPYDKINPETSRSTRFDENVDAIGRMLRHGIELGCTGFFHGGDLTENKNPKSSELEAAADLFRIPLDAGFDWRVAAGNHDGSNFELSSSSFAALAKMAGTRMKVFHKVEYDPTCHTLFIPYIHRASIQKVGEMAHIAMEGVNIRSPVTCIAHYGLLGSAIGPRNLVLAGDYLGPEQFPPGIDIVLNAHIHKEQHVILFSSHGNIDGYGAGSPVYVDMGERNDEKVFLTYDDVARKVERHLIPQKRRWISIPNGTDFAGQWTDQDIVRITGTYTPPDYPPEAIENAIKDGALPRPFVLDVQVKPERQKRPERSTAISKEGGLREALQTYVREHFHRDSETPGQVGAATASALEAIKEGAGDVFCPEIYPVHIACTNFMTFAALNMGVMPGTPLLVTGDNGKGKTNFLNLPLWILTGETSKKLPMSGVVRRGESACMGMMELLGIDQQRWRITRTVNISKAGKATQNIVISHLDVISGEWDESLNDGGLVDRQAKINAMVGGSYLTLRTVNFKFQADKDPFITADAKDRKAIIGEVTGLEPLRPAFTVLDKRRLVSVAAWKSGKDRVGGMIEAAAAQEAMLPELRTKLGGATAELEGLKPKVLAVEAAHQEAGLKASAAKQKTVESETLLAGLPNAVAALQSASQAKTTYESTYEATQATRRSEFMALQAEIKDLTERVRVAEVPAAEAIAELESAALQAGAALETARGDHAQAKSDAAVAVNEAAGCSAAHISGSADLMRARDQLLMMGPEKTSDADAAALTASKTAATVAGGEVEAAQTEAAEAAAALAVRTRVLEDLKKERAEFNESDIGTCKRCGQPIDSTHIQSEIARLDGEVRKAVEGVDAAGVRKSDADAVVLSARANHQGALDSIQSHQDKLEATNRHILGRTELAGKVAALELSLSELEGVLETKNVACAALGAALEKLTGELTAATQSHTNAGVARDTAKAKVSAAATLTATLAAKTERLASVRAAGVTALAAHEEEVKRLFAVVCDAERENTRVESLRTTYTALLTTARADSDTCATAATEAAVALQAVRGQLEAAETRVKTIQDQIANIEAQQKKVSDARFELSQLLERMEIDVMAAQLLDPKAGLPVYLIDQSLPFLEDRANNYMAELGMDNLVIELVTQEGDKETLSILIDDGEPGPKLDAAAYSGGQLDRVEIAMKNALGDLQQMARGVRLGLQCFDEPTGGLNAAGKEALVHLLFKRAEQYPITIVVSHDESFKSYFDNRIDFTAGTRKETVVT